MGATISIAGLLQFSDWNRHLTTSQRAAIRGRDRDDESR